MTPFIQPDEHHILMDNPDVSEIVAPQAGPSVPIALDDLKAIRDAGVSVALEFVLWDRLEPVRGQYDWSMTDEVVTRCRAAGLKALLQAPDSVPTWAPDAWYVQTPDHKPVKTVDPAKHSTVWGCFSPWNDEAMAYYESFITTLCRRYSADDVLVIQSWSRDGEAALPPGVPALFDPCAVQSFRAWIGEATAMPDPNHYATRAWMHDTIKALLVRQARLYCDAHPSRTVWTQLHPYYSPWVCAGNENLIDYLTAIREAVQPDHFYGTLFTYFDNGHDSFVGAHAREAKAAAGVEYFVGSEWPEGLAGNTPKAVEAGLRGLLTGPTHPYLKRTRVEPWMLQAWRQSRAVFEQGRTPQGGTHG